MTKIQYNKVIIYEWPASQKCMECRHGEFITSDTFNRGCYRCVVGCESNDGIKCPQFKDDK